MNNTICPCCKSNNYAVIQCRSFDEYGGGSKLFVFGIGAIRLNVCVYCGCTFVAGKDLQRIKKIYEGEK